MSFALLDCTVRDGGYTCGWQFSERYVKRLYRALAQAGVDYVELGFVDGGGEPGVVVRYSGQLCGPWRSLTEDVLRRVVQSVKSGTQRPKVAVMVDFAKADLVHFQPSDRSVIELVRVAFHKEDMKGALVFCGKLHRLGYCVSANAMATTRYTAADREQLAKLAVKHRVDIVYVADSYGCMTVTDMVAITQHLRALLPAHVQLGLHAHDNLGHAFSLVEHALNARLVDIVDGTMNGLGRGAGNMATERLVSHWQRAALFSPKSLQPLLPLVRRNRRLYLLTAHLDTHPNYAVKLHEYHITDAKRVWQILSLLCEREQHAKWSAADLDTAILDCASNKKKQVTRTL